MPGLGEKTVFITGASRGIGLAIALRAAREGANVVVAAKTAVPHPKLPGTAYTAASAIKAAGGNSFPTARRYPGSDNEALDAVDKAVERFRAGSMSGEQRQRHQPDGHGRHPSEEVRSDDGRKSTRH